MSTKNVINKDQLLQNWLGNRNLTRRVIEAFPEDELFNFSIGGMRSFADLAKEMISIALPGLEGIVNHSVEPYNHELDIQTKAELLSKWDVDTPKIIELYNQIPEDRFQEEFNLFGQFSFPIVDNITYFIENEIHHRGQGYVYLRALNIEPPAFWER